MQINKMIFKSKFSLFSKKNEIHYKNIDEMDISVSKEHEVFFEEFDKVNVDEISPRQSLDIFYKLKLLRNIK